MTLVDEIERKKNKILQNVVKQKWIQLSDQNMQVENEFIDLAIARKTSNNCQKMFEDNEKSLES